MDEIASLPRRPWLCLLGLHAWRFLFFTAGWHLYRCDRCGMDRGHR